MAKDTELSSYDTMLGVGGSTSTNTKSTSGGQRASMREVASRGHETFLSGRRKWVVGGGVLALWMFLGYKAEVVPSPTEAVNGVLDLAGWVITIPDRMTNDDGSASSATQNTTPDTTPASSDTAVDTSVVPTSLGKPTNLVPVVTPPPQSVSASTVLPPTPTTIATQRTVTAAYVGHDGGDWQVICYGPNVPITIDPNGGPALTQIKNQTPNHEAWDVGANGSPQDNELYNIVSGGALQFMVATECEGLETW